MVYLCSQLQDRETPVEGNLGMVSATANPILLAEETKI
jgi:hypothetical protein